MRFFSLEIKNFRNFENIKIQLDNRNVCFGLNDVGKSNLMYALRMLLDKDVRKNNCVESDYYQHNISNPIEMVLGLDLSDEDNLDTEKLRAKIKGNMLSSENILYIKLIANYNETELSGNPELFWGGDLNNLFPMNSKGISYDIDAVFNVVYIDSYVDMYKLFAKNAKRLISCTENDKTALEKIDKSIKELNENIAILSGVQNLETEISNRIKQYRSEKIEVQIKSEIAVKELFSNIIPYLKAVDDDNLYPTAGDGSKKLIAYALFDIIATNIKESKINLFFVEEPENHLHKSIQVALSKILFNNDGYEYLFVTTHSSYILHEMDDVNLIRLYKDCRNECFAHSVVYKLPTQYQDLKKVLNERFTEALFVNKVLLVEGISEKLLFNRILQYLNPSYEAQGGFILVVDGIGFSIYYDFLTKLGIKVFVKTDNDLQYNPSKSKYNCLGLSRCNKMLGKELFSTLTTDKDSVEEKRKIYNENIDKLNEIRETHQIFLSRCDLENDLDEAIHTELAQYTKMDHPVEYLQKSKKYNMACLVNSLSKEVCAKIAKHYNFQCLKEFLA